VPLFVIRIKKVAIYESSKNCYDLDNLLTGKCPVGPPCLPALCMLGSGPSVGRQGESLPAGTQEGTQYK
jgi:hypothetical protein